MRGCYFVTQQGLAQRRRCTLIKKHLHSSHFKGASCSVFKHGAHLVGRNAWEPSHEIMQGSAVLEIFKQRGNRHPAATKNPSPADAAGVSFNGIA